MKFPVSATALRTAIATLLVALAATAAFAQITRGFRAVTADGARRVDLARSPRSLPAIPLIDSTGRTFPLSDIGEHVSQATLITLVYTHCVTICRTSVSGQAYLQEEIRARGLDHSVKLLTLSFDPARDTPEALAAYARQLKADTKVWTFATVADGNDLAALLKLFEIVVLPDGLGGYSHNAALFLVDPQARLVRAYDIDRPDTALADLLQAKGA
jgi:protein SCO1/2